MKVSLMITSYNLVDSIDQSIQSVVKQNLPFSWELLIGDDGSDDGTLDKINKWKNEYPENIQVFVMSRENDDSKTGMRAARNRANLLEHATGDYLIFLDGDDCFTNNDKIQKQIALLDDKANKNCSCCAHNIYVYYPNDESKSHHSVDRNLKTKTITVKQYWPKMYFHTDTLLFRKECKVLMLHPLYRDYLNDNFITYLALQYGDVLYLEESMAQYNITGQGLWTGKNKLYSYFRNLLGFDLEVHVNKSLRWASYVRHLYAFRMLLKYYKEEKDDVKGLISGLDPNIFQTTLFIANISDKSINNRLRRAFFKVKIEFIYLVARVQKAIRIICGDKVRYSL